MIDFISALNLNRTVSCLDNYKYNGQKSKMIRDQKPALFSILTPKK